MLPPERFEQYYNLIQNLLFFLFTYFLFFFISYVLWVTRDASRFMAPNTKEVCLVRPIVKIILHSFEMRSAFRDRTYAIHIEKKPRHRETQRCQRVKWQQLDLLISHAAQLNLECVRAEVHITSKSKQA